jgi:hypothetical protein
MEIYKFANIGKWKQIEKIKAKERRTHERMHPRTLPATRGAEENIKIRDFKSPSRKHPPLHLLLSTKISCKWVA